MNASHTRLFVCLLLALVTLDFGCVHSPDQKIGYGGKSWSLTEIFPAGPNRDLAAAAAVGDLSGIDHALSSGADVNFRGANDLTPLWWAAWDQNLAGFTHLLERGADPNVLPSKNSPVMHTVAEMLWPSGFLKAALKHGGNPELRDNEGRRVIYAAIAQGTREHLDVLLAAGANVNRQPDEVNSAPIFLAALARHYDWVLLFLERGADPAVKNRGGQDLAFFIGTFPYDPNSEHYVWRERVIRFLRSKGIEAHPPPNEGKRTKPLPADLV